MSAAALPTDHRLDGLPIRSVLDGLARLHQLVAVADLNGRVLWLSDALGSICGLERHIGRQLDELLRGRESLGPILEELIETGAVVRRNVEIERRSGDSVSVEVSAFLTSQKREEALVLAVVRASEARERADARLRQSVDFLSDILDTAPDGVIAVDRSGFVTYANPVVGEMLDQPIENLLHNPVALFLRNTAGLGAIVADFDQDVTDHDIELHTPEGRSMWLSVSSRTLRDAQGEDVGAVAFLRDITDRKRIEEKLEHKNGELENYVHSVSHDLRSPLVSVLGFARLLRQDYEGLLDETGAHFLDRIEQAGHTMESLIQDLLELSRIGARGEQRSLVDPRAVLQQLHAELKPQIDEAGIHLCIPEHPPMLLCDRTRLYQVFSNLIGNALAHMGPCGDPRIDIEIREEPGQHIVRVSDNGCGIDPQYHERIFEVFKTLGPRADGRRSTGIGLAIVKKIARTHGGDVWVDSTPGEGAAFNVSFPRD